MGKLYTGQKIPLSVAFSDDDGVVDISGGTISFDYWIPGNVTAIADGTLPGTITTGAEGTATGEITAVINVTSGKWKIQASATISGDEWPAVVTTYYVYSRGAEA